MYLLHHMSHSSLFSFQWSSLSLQDPRLLRQLLYSIKPTSHCQELTVTFILFLSYVRFFPPLYSLYFMPPLALTNLKNKSKLTYFFINVPRYSST